LLQTTTDRSESGGFRGELCDRNPAKNASRRAIQDMFSHGAATLSLDSSPEWNSSRPDSPARNLPFSPRVPDPLVSGEPVEADNDRSSAAQLIGAPPPQLSVGLILYLTSIGLVATATIGVFFGIAFLLLLQPTRRTLPNADSSISTAQVEPLMHDLLSSSDKVQRATTGKFEPATFRPSMPSSNEATAALIFPVVARPAAVEVLALRTNDAAETNKAAQSTAAPLVAPQAEVDPPSRESLTVASTRSAPATSAAPADPASISPAAPVRPGLSAADITDLLDHGDALLGIGDIASARLFYERAVEAGNGRAALHLGASFDPAFLGRAGLNKMQADSVQAHFWYDRAVDLEAVEAKLRLNRVDSNQGQ
jgi:hypothetical protein